MNNDFIKHANKPKTKQINGQFYTNTITCNKTLLDGSVVNVLEDNAEFAKAEVDNIRLS